MLAMTLVLRSIQMIRYSIAFLVSLVFLVFPWAFSPRTSSVGKAGIYFPHGHRPLFFARGRLRRCDEILPRSIVW
jgi:hypothetical protein